MRHDIELKEELTTEMHQEFIGHEIPDLDIRVMGVCGATKRGIPLEDALARYNLTEEEYQGNYERVLHRPYV